MAQLGARFHGMEEVIGSIPIRSTKQPLTNQAYAGRRALFGRDRVGLLRLLCYSSIAALFRESAIRS